MSVTKITELTEEQTAQMPGWRDKWIAVGLCTEPAARQRAEKAYRACYRFAKLNDNIPVIWVDSPLMGAFAGPIAANIISATEEVKKPNRSQPDLAGFVTKAVGKRLKKPQIAALTKVVERVISASSDLSPGILAAALKEAPTRLWWHYWMGGSMWPAWIAFESFFREVCGLVLEGDLTQRAEVYAETALAGCYWWPNRYFIIACERPKSIHQDPEGRLHSMDRKAIEWPDGWGIHVVHGVTVPDWIIEEKEKVTAEKITAENNAEVRRVMIDIFGAANYLQAIKAERLDYNEIRGTLWKAEIPNDEPLVMIEVVNPTPEGYFEDYGDPEPQPVKDELGNVMTDENGQPVTEMRRPQRFVRTPGPNGELPYFKHYFLRVPPDMTTAQQAVAWTGGMKPESYNPTMES